MSSAGTRGSGTEGRQWAGQSLADTGPGTPDYETVEETTWIPVRDGIRLSALLIRPVVVRQGPCVVVTNGYSGLDFSLLPYLRSVAARGYTVVLARLRGVAPSEGRAGLYEGYGHDGYDVVEG